MKNLTLALLLSTASAIGVAATAASPTKKATKPMASDDAKLIETAKNAVSYPLIDPSSATFRNIRISPNRVAVCGEINAKNSYGGYVGYRPFIYTKDKNGVYGDGSYFVEARWDERCVRGTLEDDNGPNALPLSN
jgi:hypothetical protein